MQMWNGNNGDALSFENHLTIKTKFPGFKFRDSHACVTLVIWGREAMYCHKTLEFKKITSVTGIFLVFKH